MKRIQTRMVNLMMPMDNILSWNMRWLNSRQKQVEVKNLIIYHNVILFSFLETKLKSHNMHDLYLNMCLVWCFPSSTIWHNSGRIVCMKSNCIPC